MECIQKIKESRAIGWQWRGIQELRRQRDGLPTGLQALDQHLALPQRLQCHLPGQFRIGPGLAPCPGAAG
jgi:hypothetical protein